MGGSTRGSRAQGSGDLEVWELGSLGQRPRLLRFRAQGPGDLGSGSCLASPEAETPVVDLVGPLIASEK